tara:strand:- start:404 stop:607 length:204 start_codon:yes stop_codon:yes gene_type:complete
MNITNKFIPGLIVIAIYPIDAYAYINPSTVGLVITALAGSIAVIGYYFRTIIYKIKSFFSNIKNKDS